MGYVLRLKELMPLLNDIMVIDEGAEVGASEGEIAFRVYVPDVSEISRRCGRTSWSATRKRSRRSTATCRSRS